MATENTEQQLGKEKIWTFPLQRPLNSMKMLKISVVTVNFSFNFHILDCLASNKNERNTSMQISEVYIPFLENKRRVWKEVRKWTSREKKRAKKTQWMRKSNGPWGFSLSMILISYRKRNVLCYRSFPCPWHLVTWLEQDDPSRSLPAQTILLYLYKNLKKKKKNPGRCVFNFSISDLNVQD